MERIDKQVLWCCEMSRRKDLGLVRCIGPGCERWKEDRWCRCIQIVAVVRNRERVSFNPDAPYEVEAKAENCGIK